MKPLDDGVLLPLHGAARRRQLGWLLRQLLFKSGALGAQWQIPVFLKLVIAKLAIPVRAEYRVATTWHPHHMAERDGLFVIILLGESVLAASMAV